ncbi:alpha/beta fold hydrolase [Nocardia sp. NBC_01327]|uniref:alpha/beta fold hydrolase n=1 Tax=Nocardia sp. NBC_01327 TaxID=2903593 RepID=UPI002E12F540|nr:alpha/beta fold hydrolase [Nocardia sp. NBC_01327]
MDVTYENTLKTVRTDKGVLRYHEAGDGPPVILLHGSGIGVNGWRNFGGNLAAFAKHFHCYILEFPGFGASDPVPGHPVLTAVDSVLRFMDALGIESAPLVGNSMGGVVGVMAAIAHPARVDKLVAIGGVGTNIFSPGPSEGTRLLREFADNPSREALVRWLNCMVFDPKLVTEDLIEERWRAAIQPDALQTLQAMYGSKAAALQEQAQAQSNTPPYWSMLHKVQCPTLMVWGKDDRQCPLDMAQVPLRLIPSAELHVLSKCGHWVFVEAKDAFERTSIEFLQR